ncbi:MAG: hypothetical protein GDA52_09780 [Rhodobacteraceae bacterium]|nr:hypothetical protein [Paracoccaceae bacterium]
MTGTDNNDTLTGNDQSDNLNGGWGHDFIDGGADHDFLHGGFGDDTLVGGAGGDALHGGAGSDTASYAGSSAGVNVNLASGAASGGHAEGDWLVSIENLVGSDHNDHLTGNGGANHLDGGAGNDTLTGGSGGDTFVLHATNNGNDTITDFEDGVDSIMLRGIGFEDLTIQSRAEGSDALIRWDGGQAYLQGVSPTALTASDFTSAFNIIGAASDDTLTGSGGNDTLTGGDGADTFVFDSFEDDTITDFVSGEDSIRITAQGVGFDDLRIESMWLADLLSQDWSSGVVLSSVSEDEMDTAVIMWNGGSLTLTGVDYQDVTAADFIFDNPPAPEPEPAPQPQPDPEPAAPKPQYKVIAGNGNNNSLTGTNGRDSINGFAGNDKLIGRRDDDVLTGGSGDDSLIGNTGNDTLRGNLGDDTLIGGHGDDVLTGGMNADTFVFSSGHGNDTITDFADGVDLIQITTSGVGFSDMTLADSSGDAKVTWDGGTMLLTGVAHTALTAEDFILADANDETEVAPKPEPGPAPDQEPAAPKPPYKVIKGNGNNNSLTGTNGRDSINGFAGNDKLIGRRDDDVLTGGGGDDSLIGNTGNDTLRGNLGDDTLIGGHGDDVLTGGMNADTFVFSSGHGNDTITDFEDGVDLIQITASGVGFDDLAIASEGTDTDHASVVTWSGGTITLEGVSSAQLTGDDFVF